MLPHSVKSRVFDSVSKMPIRYVTPVPYSEATGLVADVYELVADEFFINGAITTHSVRPPLLAGMWCGGRELVMVHGHYARDVKEGLGVSFAQTNGCTYCEDMLVSVVYAGDQKFARDIRDGNQQDIDDAEVRALHRWAQNYRSIDSDILRHPPFNAQQAPEMIGVAFMFNYLNRYVKVFFDGTPLNPLFGSQSIKTGMFKTFGNELRASVTKHLEYGRMAALLPPAELPPDMGWAESDDHIAEPIARWAAAIERAAVPDIPERVREVVGNAISQWRGEQMGLSRSWVEPYLVGLAENDYAAAKIGLLTALAPTQISDDIIDDYRQYYEGDAALVSLVSWSAFTATRRIAAWIADAADCIPYKDTHMELAA